MQQINSTTFTAPQLGDVKPVVTIGGFSVDKFYPNVNNSFHNNEFFFNLNCIDDIVTDESAIKLDGVISQTINNEKHEYYIDDSGRLKWDKVFSSCPDSMRVRFRVRKSAGVHFYYQGELTLEEIADGRERPDDIKGSYAVYCDKANNRYKTGKLCHIPRPFVIDASGDREWCVMTYEEISDTEGMLYIDMPGDFMRNADYSLGDVRLDPAIGYTSTLASSFNAAYLRILFTNMEAASDGDASAMYVYGRSTTVDRDVDAGYYNDNGSGGAGTVAGSTAVTLTSTAGWRSASVTGTVTGGNDYPTVIQAREYGDVYLYYDDAPTNQLLFISGVTTIPDNPTPSTPGAAYRIAVYLEYTESGGASIGPLVGPSALVGGGVLCGQGNLIN